MNAAQVSPLMMNVVGPILWFATIALMLLLCTWISKRTLRKLGHKSQKESIPLHNAESALFAALERLRTSPDKDGSFVILEDYEHFVQFTGSQEKPILLDLPCRQFTNQNHVIHARAILYPYVMHSIEQMIILQKKDLTPLEATRLGIRILREVCGLRDEQWVSITEGKTNR